MGVVERCELVGGSFFDSVPAGGDAYTLKSVIHDWEDEDSVRILRVCRDAMSANATLLVLEWDLGPPNAVAGPKFSDLNMLVAPGGRERTVDEYRALFEAAGSASKASCRTPRVGSFSKESRTNQYCVLYLGVTDHRFVTRVQRRI